MKKKILLVALALPLLLSGCGNTKSEDERHMFLVERTLGYFIYADKDTGVMYFCKNGGVVEMVNPDGTPKVYDFEVK